MNITPITDTFSVSSQIGYDEFKTLNAMGYSTVINNRPDGESADQPPSAALAIAAKKAGITYTHIPIQPGRGVSEADKIAFRKALAAADHKVLAFCRSGMRSRNLYKAVQPGKPGFLSRLFRR